MKPLSNIDDSLNPSAVNEVTHDIDSNHIDAQWLQPNSFSCPLSVKSAATCDLHQKLQF